MLSSFVVIQCRSFPLTVFPLVALLIWPQSLSTICQGGWSLGRDFFGACCGPVRRSCRCRTAGRGRRFWSDSGCNTARNGPLATRRSCSSPLLSCTALMMTEKEKKLHINHWIVVLTEDLLFFWHLVPRFIA